MESDKYRTDLMWTFVKAARFRRRSGALKRGLAWCRSTLLHQRGSALTDFLELHFKATKFLRA
jgi:hypothetical protein